VVRDRVEDPTVTVFLANDPRTTVAWYKLYFALTAVSAVFVGLVRLDVPPFDRVGPLAVAALVVGLFAIASVGYWYDVYRWRRRSEDTPPDFLVTLEADVPLEDRDEGRKENEAETEDEEDSG
jgi:hypothetical protein